MPKREVSSLDVTREALLAYRQRWEWWLTLVHTTETERALAEVKIALIDSALNA
jgi:hypothetical protein